MSQDKVVTPTSTMLLPHISWIDRSLSLASIQSLRRLAIKKIHGSLQRSLRHCGCGESDKSLLLHKRASAYGLLQPVKDVSEVLISTECRVAPVLWLLMVPDGGRYSWCEIIELTDPDFTEPILRPMVEIGPWPLQCWETFGHNELKFKVSKNVCPVGSDSLVRARASIIREVLPRTTELSHINLSFDTKLAISPESMNNETPDLSEYEFEFLRTRYVPQWRQSGDMAYRAFSTYTVTRRIV